ncbi:alpha/beta hydrolase [Allomeiothermus silvanus]|uniref:alpha/beta hydrolase n=1 Tax=Allomeiothermus silvanus TaxID=52022 RepID=UPI0023F40DFF|nr:alpha/beta fold hydrolase [Allomeiothermus silvanus]
MTARVVVAIVGFLWVAWALPTNRSPQSVAFQAADRVQVYGTYYPTGDRTRPVVLLFHQSESNRGEYAQIAPRLVELGFNALAIDQRVGGSMWGMRNQTYERLRRIAGYEETLRDLEAALNWVTQSGHTGAVLVWGSSYSSALVFLLAAQHPKVAGILSFSPWEYLWGEDTVRQAAAKVQVPVFITSAKDEAEQARVIFRSVASPNKVQFVPRHDGRHGSPALDGEDREEYWQAVRAFLTQFN